jgi:hypothetical protein
MSAALQTRGRLNTRPPGLNISACRTKGTEAYSNPYMGYLSEGSPRSSGAGALAGVCATG